MKHYETGLGKAVIASVIVGVVVIAGFLAVSYLLPGGESPPDGPTGPDGGFGTRAAEYLNSRRDDVAFYWMCNSSFVNERLTQYYQETEPDAFVDGVRMIKNQEIGTIEVLFAPYSANLTGTGQVSLDGWASMSGSLVDDAIGQMSDVESHPDHFPSTWPIDFYVSIFFDDNTFFYIGYTEADQMVFLQNGTWSGQFTEYGHPETTGYADTGYWLDANGLMTDAIDEFYEVITENVSYPE
ncbi:MAG: hypothetical protein ACOC38_11590 [Promethearchaeia archaeon]